MIELIITIISLALSIFIVYLSQISWFLLLPVFIGIWAVLLIIFFFSCGLIACTVKKGSYIEKPKKIFSLLTYHICRFVMFFLRIKIYKEGFEKIDKNSKMLIVSNHQSNLDPLMLIAAFGNINLTFIMKESILKVPVIGRCLYSAGFLPLDRNNNRKGLETIVKSIKRVQDGFPIGVFPEGTRSKGPNMGRLHDGTFKIATRAASSIVVCIIDNTYSNKKRFPFRRTKILIKVCEVLKYDDFKESTTKEIAENVTEIMMTSLQDARSRYKWLNETINKKGDSNEQNI